MTPKLTKIPVWMTPGEHAEIKALAKERGISMSNLFRLAAGLPANTPNANRFPKPGGTNAKNPN